MARRQLRLKDPSRFRDPHGLSFEKYLSIQTREQQRYQQEKAALPSVALNMELDPHYLERATEQFVNNYFPELSATHYIAVAVERAPFEELKKCSLFQLIDEQRHMEMDREVLQRARIPEVDWRAAWEQPGTTYRFFQHLLELDDPFEILVKANFVGEGAAGPASFKVLEDGARERGDLLSAINHKTRIRDETRHISYAQALVRALIEDDPGNQEVMQQWQDEVIPLFADVAKRGERREWWEGFIGSYYKIALPLGFRPTPVNFN